MSYIGRSGLLETTCFHCPFLSVLLEDPEAPSLHSFRALSSALQVWHRQTPKLTKNRFWLGREEHQMNAVTSPQSCRRDICRAEASSALKSTLRRMERGRCDSSWLQPTVAGIKQANVTAARWNKRVDVTPDSFNGEQSTTCRDWCIVLHRRRDRT